MKRKRIATVAGIIFLLSMGSSAGSVHQEPPHLNELKGALDKRAFKQHIGTVQSLMDAAIVAMEKVDAKSISSKIRPFDHRFIGLPMDILQYRALRKELDTTQGNEPYFMVWYVQALDTTSRLLHLYDDILNPMLYSTPSNKSWLVSVKALLSTLISAITEKLAGHAIALMKWQDDHGRAAPWQ